MTKRTPWIAAGTLALAIALTLPTFGGSCSSSAKGAMASADDIVETAVANGNFDTLVTAVKAAGLVDALKGDGPLTVFAPTDAAFAKLPAGTVEKLLKPENRDALVSILTYHVAPGQLTAKDVLSMDRVKTLNGQRPSISTPHGSAKIDNATIEATDIMVANGVIHVIDEVLLPADLNIVETAVEAGSFSTLAAALEAAGLVNALQGDGPFTVFAPTDRAFAKLPAGTVESLLRPENKDQLVAILTYHVIPGQIYSSDVRPGHVETLEGSNASITRVRGDLRINQATIVNTDIATTNGVIHVIDEVILPEAFRAAVDPASELIRLAINRGAPLFNNRQPEACAAVYEVAAQALLSSEDFDLDRHSRAQLRSALREMKRTHDASRQAWILRDALDDVMGSRNGDEMPLASRR